MTIVSDAINAANLEEEAATAAMIVSRCHSTGLDARSYRCVIGAAVTLGMAPWSRLPRWSGDQEFVNALIDLECDLYGRLQQIVGMIARLNAAYEACPKTKRNADYLAAIETALSILGPARVKVTTALNRIMAAPDELADTYAACYRLVRAGRVLPFDGRFISGEATA